MIRFYSLALLCFLVVGCNGGSSSSSANSVGASSDKPASSLSVSSSVSSISSILSSSSEVMVLSSSALSSFVQSSSSNISSVSSSQLSSAAAVLDQCNSTAQCQDIYGVDATDCSNSGANDSVCLCGDLRCDAPLPPKDDPLLAINVAGTEYTTNEGVTYLADQFVSGGVESDTEDSIGNTEDDRLFQNYRYGEFVYDIPIANGRYDVTLSVAEIFFNTNNERVFKYDVEGTLTPAIDVYCEAGHDNVLDVHINNVEVGDGSLTIAGLATINWAAVSAIAIHTAGQGQTTSYKCDPENPAASARIFALNIDGMSVGDTYANNGKAVVTADPDSSKGNKFLRTTYEPASNGSARLTRDESIKVGTEYTLQYDVEFDSEFEFVRGGKMHGLAPDDKTSGCAAQTDDGWSARVMWRANGVGELYLYDQAREAANKKCGWEIRTGGDTEAFPGGVAFAAGNEYAISLYVKLNSASGSSDGEAEVWINGKLFARKAGIKFRSKMTNSDISNFSFSTFFGGNDSTWAPSKDVYANYDNFEVWEGRAVRNTPL